MKIVLSLLIIAICFISCTKSKEPEQIVIYNLDDFDKKVIIKDTLCESETKRAIEDIKKGLISFNISYVYDPHNSLKRFLTEQELEKKISHHLADYNIKIDTVFIIPFSDLRTPCDDLFKAHCYQNTMRNEIGKRHGNLIDNLIYKIEKQYVLEHPKEIYSINDIDYKHDKHSGREFADFRERVDLNFAADFKYPKNYRHKFEKMFSHTSAEFVLMKDGSVKNVSAVARFHNPENEKFKSYFENELINFIKKTRWVNGTIHGIPVNTQMSFTFLHK